MIVMLLLALVVGTVNRENTVSPSGDTMKGVYCIPLLSTYDEPRACPSTAHKSDVPFPEQLNVKFDALFSNVV